MIPISWKHYRCLQNQAISPALKSWLLTKSSLTEKLHEVSSGQFQIKILFQGWQRPRMDEANALNICSRKKVWVREVILLGKGQMTIFARSLFPEKTLRGKTKQLKQLNNTPLIKILCKDYNLSRSDFEITRLTKRQNYFHQIVMQTNSGNDVIWGRRSIFYLYGKPLLVSEFFLPAFI